MRANAINLCIQNVYKTNPLYSGKSAASPTKTADNVKKDAAEVKKIFREMKNNDYTTANQRTNSSHIDSIQQYGQVIRTGRQKTQSTSNSLKKLKYQFKNISSKILRSKTSAAARQVVGQAKREILRLKRAKMNSDADTEELEAAITHAKAMERVAKKKVKHLEEEEMAKATGGPCADRVVEEELKKKEDATEDMEDLEALDEFEDEYQEDITYDEMIDLEGIDISELLENLESILSDMEDLGGDTLEEIMSGLEDLMSEMADSMNELLEDMGFGEMSDDLRAIKGDMDPADLKMMKIKHRNKEMKEIVKADADYLKTVFQQFPVIDITV